MIRVCNSMDTEEIYQIINDAAQAYRGVIPDDRYHDPYMSIEELNHEMNDGVVFWGFEENNNLIGIMGIQDKIDVSLTRICTNISEEKWDRYKAAISSDGFNKQTDFNRNVGLG